MMRTLTRHGPEHSVSLISAVWEHISIGLGQLVMDKGGRYHSLVL